MIEVAAALLVLTIGFLAAGGMQVGAMRANQEVYHESQARLLLADMMDRMRNNPRGVRAGAYDDMQTGDLVATDACVASACDPVALAARDLALWSASLVSGDDGVPPRLPANGAGAPATGSIGALADGYYELSLSWEALIDGAPEARSATTRFLP